MLLVSRDQCPKHKNIFSVTVTVNSSKLYLLFSWTAVGWPDVCCVNSKLFLLRWNRCVISLAGRQTSLVAFLTSDGLWRNSFSWSTTCQFFLMRLGWHFVDKDNVLRPPEKANSILKLEKDLLHAPEKSWIFSIRYNFTIWKSEEDNVFVFP